MASKGSYAKHTLWFLVLLALVGICSYLFYSFYSKVKTNMIEELNKRQMVFAKQAAGNIQDFMGRYTTLLTHLAENQNIVAFGNQGKAVMELFFTTHSKEIKGISRVDRRGRILYTVPFRKEAIGVDISSQKHMQEILKTLKPTVSDVFTTIQGYRAIAYHYPIFRDNAFQGTIAIAIGFDQLATQHLQNIRLGENGYAWMVSKDGVELYCPVPGHTGNSVFENCKDFPDILAMANEMVQGKEGITTYTFNQIRGRNETATKHAVYFPVAVGNTYWSIVVATPEDEVLAGMIGFRNRLFLVFGLLLIGSIFLAYSGFRARGIIEEEEKRREAEEALRESEARYRAIFENTGTATLIIEDDTTVSLANTELEKLTGYSRQETEGKKSWTEFVAKEDVELMRRMHRERRDNPDQTLTHYEFRLITRSGDVRDVYLTVDMIPGTTKSIASILDITESKRIQEALRQSETKYRGIFENAVEGIFQSTRDGRFMNVNPAFARMLGYDSPTEMTLHITDISTQYCVNPEDRAHYSAFLEEKGIIEGFESEVYRKDGSKVWVSINARAVRNDAGDLLYYEGTVENIAGRKQAEQEKARLEAEIRQIQKMEAIGTLAGGIAHDFNNLLMGIQGYTSLAMMSIEPANPLNEQLAGIEEIVKSGAGLTRQLLGFARGGKYEVKTSDLNNLMRRVLEMFGRAKKEIQIQNKYEEHLYAVEIDQGQIEQAFLNLFVNAWQAMPDGGILTVRTENAYLSEKDGRPFTVPAGNYARVTVADTGIGMDDKTMERIFEPFFTTRARGKGTGLGLASTYGIIKGHQGFIEVSSTKGVGTTFIVYLPASGKKVEKDTVPAQAIPEKGTGTILLIDDEEPVAKVTKAGLEMLGYKVLTASTGREALDIFRKHQGEIHLVILDMIMPEMGGGETFDNLRAMAPEVKVILSSGYSIDGQARSIMERGCRAFLQKPFRIQELSGKIREVLDGL